MKNVLYQIYAVFNHDIFPSRVGYKSWKLSPRFGDSPKFEKFSR